MSPADRRQLGLAVLTAYMGPSDHRAADISLIAEDVDPREILFGVLSVARDVVQLAAIEAGVFEADVLRALAEQEATENG